MSHHKERAEKKCLNCGTAPLVDRYCHHCGQENVEPKQSVWHLITHVFNDITHFDGKFFSTMKMLLLKPGYLSSAYLMGQRTTYLDPIRMYLFISAAFFLFAHFTAGDTFKMDRVSVIHDKEMVRKIDSLRVENHVDNFQLVFRTITTSNGSRATIVILNVYNELRHGVKHYDSLVKTGRNQIAGVPSSAAGAWLLFTKLMRPTLIISFPRCLSAFSAHCQRSSSSRSLCSHFCFTC